MPWQKHNDIILRIIGMCFAARESLVTSEQQRVKDKQSSEEQATVHDEDADPAAPRGPITNGQDRDVNTTPETEIVGDDESSAGENVASMIAERDEYLDQLQRSRAEFANFRRRNDQERTMLRQLASRDVLAQFLPVIDDLDRALAAIPEQERGSGWVIGVSLIQSKLNGTVERLGITKIDAVGKPFDPARHEAVSTEPGSSGNTVVEVYQSGYQLGDLLVRPAMVKTGDADDASGTEPTDAANEPEAPFNA